MSKKLSITTNKRFKIQSNCFDKIDYSFLIKQNNKKTAKLKP